MNDRKHRSKTPGVWRTPSICGTVYMAKRSTFTSPQTHHAKKATFCDSWMLQGDKTRLRIWHTTVNITTYRLRIITENNEIDKSHSTSITRPNIIRIKSIVAHSLIHHKVLSRWSTQRSKLSPCSHCQTYSENGPYLLASNMLYFPTFTARIIGYPTAYSIHVSPCKKQREFSPKL